MSSELRCLCRSRAINQGEPPTHLLFAKLWGVGGEPVVGKWDGSLIVKSVSEIR